jgi:prepilin-type N-terminal cleavage/methylation domain-containing protein
MIRAILTIELQPRLKVLFLKPWQMELVPVHWPGPTENEHRRWFEGFTLVELMIVVAIIATLSAIAIPNYISYRYKAQIAAAMTSSKTKPTRLMK